jgi:signal transduction histidine kinase/CheY-like chemotaxis protein
MTTADEGSQAPASPYISALPASPGQLRFAIAMALASALLFAAAVPFARRPLGQVWAFIPAYQSALVVSDLVTAALLFGQLLHVRSRAILVLAYGYVFTAIMAVIHALSFPGLFAPTGLMGAGPQSTAWLYMFWHAGFPLCVVGYTLLKGEFEGKAPVVWSAAAVVAAAAFFAWLAVRGAGLLPPIMSGNGYAPAYAVVTTLVWIVSAVALVMVWRRRPRSILDLWLAVVMFAWVLDIALSAVLNAGRFDLGFYAGRVYGLVASTLVLIVLLVEDARLHRRLREANEALEISRREALAAERAKGVFLATMSHEIRTPLNGIIGTLELISMGKLEGEQRTQLGIVRTSAHSLLRIIDDILDFSRIESGKLALAPEPASVAAVVERVCDMYSGLASAKGLTLRREIDAAIGPSLRADPLRLQQILANFTSNAIKFTERGEVRVGVHLLLRTDRTERLLFHVQDTGIGVAEEQRARLFQPFTQASDDTSARYGGSGLGLSICKRLAELMGGCIAMESEPGVGTRMTLDVELPIAPEMAAGAAPGPSSAAVPVARRPAPTVAEAEREGTLLLLVDDHPINRTVLLRQVAALGYAAEAFEDGEQALEAWRTGRFAAIVTDCHMPGMSGYDLARHVRHLEAIQGKARAPILACTANVFSSEAEKCFNAGMDDYLPKPVGLADLGQLLDRWLPIGTPGRAAAPVAPPRPELPASSSDPVDEARLAEATLGDPALAREALRTFRKAIVPDCATLEAAVDVVARERCAKAAHRIRSSSLTIGAVRLAAICERIEAAALEGDFVRVRNELAALRVEVRHVEAYIAGRSSDSAFDVR